MRTRWLTVILAGLVALSSRAQAQQARSDESARQAFEATMAGSFGDREALGRTLLVAGLASVASSVPMLIPSEPDQGFRVAGVTTLVFGGVNAVLGGLSLASVDADRARFASDEAAAARASAAGLAEAERAAVADAHSAATIYAVNLGLDALYLAGAVLGVVGSVARFDDHPNRWLGAGMALGAQAIFLTAFDATAVARTSAHHDALLVGLRASGRW